HCLLMLGAGVGLWVTRERRHEVLPARPHSPERPTPVVSPPSRPPGRLIHVACPRLPPTSPTQKRLDRCVIGVLSAQNPDNATVENARSALSPRACRR